MNKFKLILYNYQLNFKFKIYIKIIVFNIIYLLKLKTNNSSLTQCLQISRQGKSPAPETNLERKDKAFAKRSTPYSTCFQQKTVNWI